MGNSILMNEAMRIITVDAIRRHTYYYCTSIMAASRRFQLLLDLVDELKSDTTCTRQIVEAFEIHLHLY